MNISPNAADIPNFPTMDSAIIIQLCAKFQKQFVHVQFAYAIHVPNSALLLLSGTYLSYILFVNIFFLKNYFEIQHKRKHKYSKYMGTYYKGLEVNSIISRTAKSFQLEKEFGRQLYECI